MIAAANTHVFGLPVELVVPVVAGVVGWATGQITNRQLRRDVRAQSHDQVVLEREGELWQTVKDDNKALRKEVGELRAEVRRYDARVDQLEGAMRHAGVPVPDPRV